MEVALIPPLGMIRFCAMTDYRLLLPELCHNRTYRRALRPQRGLYRHPNTYMIMDNGAAEGKAASFVELFDQAVRYDVHEIVCPDQLANSDVTVEMTNAFLRHAKYAQEDRNFYPAYGAVVQGKSLSEAKECINRLLGNLRIADAISVLYLPRLLLSASNMVTIRIKLAEYIQDKFRGNYMIHFLGASALWPEEPMFVSQETPWVRSIDTSLPFIYTWRRARLLDNLPVELRQREEPYFYSKGSDWDPQLTQINCQQYINWAKGKILGE